MAAARHKGFVDDQLPLAVVEVNVQRVVAPGNCESVQVEVSLGVQNSRVIGAQTPYAAVRLERVRTIEDVASPDGRSVVADPELLAVDDDAGFGTGGSWCSKWPGLLSLPARRPASSSLTKEHSIEFVSFPSRSFRTEGYRARLPHGHAGGATG